MWGELFKTLNYSGGKVTSIAKKAILQEKSAYLCLFVPRFGAGCCVSLAHGATCRFLTPHKKALWCHVGRSLCAESSRSQKLDPGFSKPLCCQIRDAFGFCSSMFSMFLL